MAADGGSVGTDVDSTKTQTVSKDSKTNQIAPMLDSGELGSKPNPRRGNDLIDDNKTWVRPLDEIIEAIQIASATPHRGPVGALPHLKEGEN